MPNECLDRAGRDASGERVDGRVVSSPEEALVVRQEHVPDARARRVVDVLADGVEVATTLGILRHRGRRRSV